MSKSEAIIIINAGLTRSGNEPITDFDDGSDEAVCASTNYEEIVKEELARYGYSWSKTDISVTRIDEKPLDEWAYIYQLPSDLIKLTRVYVNGMDIPYKKKGNKFYCNEIDNVNIEYIFRAEEEDWSYDFRGKIIVLLEALFLRALSEQYTEAEARENTAEGKGAMTRSQDSQNRTPKDRRAKSRLVSIRRA